MRSKIYEMNNVLAISDIDCFCVQETWFNSSVQGAELIANTEFDLHRFDRGASRNQKMDGGGVFLLTRKALRALPLTVTGPFPDGKPFIEFTAVRFEFCELSFILCCMYLVPDDRTVCVREFDIVMSSLRQQLRPGEIFIVLGDFNASSISWSYDDDFEDILIACPNGKFPGLVSNIAPGIGGMQACYGGGMP